jgi:hypothetical protein
LQIARDWLLRFNAAGPAHGEPNAALRNVIFTGSEKFGPSREGTKGVQTEIFRYDATGHRDALTRLALQRANIMHLVDLKREGYSPRRTEMRIGRLTARERTISSLSKNAAPVA